MPSDTITVPRELFEQLVQHAIDLQAERFWMRKETRQRIADEYAKLCRDVALAVAIRDQTDLPSGD